MTVVHRLLSRMPLPVVYALPGLAGTAAVALDRRLALVVLPVVTLACFGLGAALSWDLRQIGRNGSRFGREVRRLDRRIAVERRRTAVLEQLVGAPGASTDSSLARTRALLAELVNAEETTRSFIAAELHDTVAQTLSQALLQLGAGRAGDGIESVHEAETQLRAVLARLRPPELADGSLAQAVADLCSELEQRYGVAVAVRWPQESIALPGPLATTVYRFIQETLLNAAVHADGVDVRLHVEVVDDMLISSVSDHGAGFDPSEVTSVAGRHVGLQLARERARLAGGILHIDSTPGVGTTAQLRLPLVERRAAPRVAPAKHALPEAPPVELVAAR